MEYKPLRVFTDVMFFIAALIPSVVLYALDSPTLMFQRGFFCDDESIKYPYKEDTISVGVLVAVGLLVPTVTMVVCEWFLYRYFVRCSEEGSPWRPYNRRKMCCCSVHPWATALYSTIGSFGLGAAFTLLLTDSGKYMIGRLRPHFISVCNPDWSMINCTDSDGYQQYVQDIPCLGTDTHQLTDGRLSFPSGHASSAFYFFTYWVIYLQARMIPEVFGDTLLRPFLQLAGALAAILVGLSRVSDYKHHWSDVFAGSILGLVVAILVAVFVSDLLRIPISRESRIEKGEVMPLYGSGSAISDQLSSDSKDHANNVVTAIA